ncbi:hypothetical protein F4860DRAFT_501254 [Xylaria cubensis]|nr:hypothetical protein F4860DRAFT_501254 [Xylaria cubensis]
METSRRKREISSCIPCYKKKQKCENCTRRRQPELCAYYPPQAALSPGNQGTTISLYGLDSLTSQPSSVQPTSVSSVSTPFPLETTELSSVVGLFGYSEGSKSNTLALVQRLGISVKERNTSFPAEIVPEIQTALGQIPSRPIIDCLLQYFVAEVNWIDQLVYAPWLLARYQKWWEMTKEYSVNDIEFAVLFLRVCSYTSQFLPSQSYRSNNIKGVELVDIRDICSSVANILDTICSKLNGRGSLIRVQHLAFAGLGFLFQGQMNDFWAKLSCSVRVAQRIGVHLETSLLDGDTDQFEKEMSRRTFCSLYVLDSVLSFRMDHRSLFPDHLKAGNLPQMHLVPEAEYSADAPDAFTERVLQVKLVDFWKRQSLTTGLDYDVLAAQERYDKFVAEFLPTLPSVFFLEPDKRWDSRLPKLGLQRLIVHMAIFDSLCYNFRSVLLQTPSQIELLPGYKQVLLSSHKKALASAALKVLECSSVLHDMMGGPHNRYPGTIIPTFEAAVPLLWLCTDSRFLEDIMNVPLITGTPHPLSTGMASLSRHTCMQAAKDAVDRLNVLAEHSKPADAGARALAFLIARIERSSTQSHRQSESTETIDSAIQMVEIWKEGQLEDINSMFTMSDILCGTNTTLLSEWGSYGTL